METFAEIVPQIVLRIFAPLLGFCLAGWAIMLFVQLFSGKRHSCRFPFAGLVLLAIACTTLIGKNTNGVNGVGGMYLMQFNPPVIQSVTPEDISNGWRVAEVSDAGAFAPPPANAVTNERWRLRGAHDDAFRIPADGWLCPFASGVTVLSRGEIRRDIRSRDFPRAFEQDLSLLPVINWRLLPDGRNESVFWYGSTPSNTLIATWWNAALGRDATNPVCFQAELYTNGGFDYRYEDRTVRHVRVWPFDLDGDGLENSVDPEPLVAGPDAHGTNAEWYNVVCSNIVNSNAYYFVDVVTTNGLAPIYFMGDRESRLGNPVVVTLGGETNHVPLLMGVEYSVTSTVPFSVSAPANAVVSSVEVSDGRAYSVKWPLSFGFAVASGGGYEVEVLPFDPGGEFSWSASGGGLNMRGASACPYTSVSNWIGFACGTGGNYGCDGCSVEGTYSVESAMFALPSLWCGCGSSVGTNDPPSAPSVSVSFDKAVVFYEDTYTNAPNDVVEKHSTNVTLTVSAYGGEAGGMLYVSDQNIGKLVRTGGKAIAFPYTAFVPPQSGVSFSIVYEAETHSDSEGDITVTASLTPGDGWANISASAATTVVKVQLNALIPAPLDGNTSRHVYGVGETVVCNHWPKDLPASWVCQAGQMQKVQNWFWYMYTPLISDISCKPRIQAREVSYAPVISLREPIKYYCANAVNITTNVGENVAGGTGMSLELYIEPRNVSFGNIALEEVPTETGEVGGYFDNEEFIPYWVHTRERGAGDWKNIGNDNLFLIEDEAKMGEVLPPMTPDGIVTNDVSFGWRDGGIIWTIPLGWNAHGTSGETDPIKTNAVPEHQTFIITPNGTLTVIKAGYFVSRGTNAQVRLERIPQ